MEPQFILLIQLVIYKVVFFCNLNYISSQGVPFGYIFERYQYKCEICNRKLTRTNDFEIYHTSKSFGEKLQNNHQISSNFRKAISTFIRMNALIVDFTVYYVSVAIFQWILMQVYVAFRRNRNKPQKILGKFWHKFGNQIVYFCYELILHIF